MFHGAGRIRLLVNFAISTFDNLLTFLYSLEINLASQKKVIYFTN